MPITVFFPQAEPKSRTNALLTATADLDDADLEEVAAFPNITWDLGDDLDPADSAETLRRTAWEIAMAGAYGTTGESARRGTNVWPDTGGGWMNGRGDDTMTMLAGYAHMVDFFTSFEWWKTEPHDELADAGAYCLAEPGRTYAAYLPNGGQVTLKLSPGRYGAEWFQASSGIHLPAGTAEGPEWKSPKAPGHGDWAILLRRQ